MGEIQTLYQDLSIEFEVFHLQFHKAQLKEIPVDLDNPFRISFNE